MNCKSCLGYTQGLLDGEQVTYPPECLEMKVDGKPCVIPHVVLPKRTLYRYYIELINDRPDWCPLENKC